MRRDTPMPADHKADFTPNQITAIERNGNVLVLAGAGTGKTRTLVERCIVRLLDPVEPSSLAEMLLVTFTEAAAAEMKQRIRARLEEELATSARSRIEDELAFLDRAHICTLHSFCLHLVRSHFHELRLDPQLAVLTDVQRRLLMEATLDDVLKKHFQSGGEHAKAIQELLQAYGAGVESSIHELVLKLHEYTQSRANPNAWLDLQQSRFATADPALWDGWFATILAVWRNRWLHRLLAQPAANFRARDFARILAEPPGDAKAIFNAIRSLDEDWDGGKTKYRKPIEQFFEEAAFLDSLLDAEGGCKPLHEDWSWVRNPMLTLLQLLREFSQEFSLRKRAEGMLDFADFEQFALELLCGPDGNTLTPLAEQYRRQFKWVMVDEYQDINPSQDAILRALSAPSGNRFLVGDLKQSIYRFRLAEPRIFQSYEREWSQDSAATVVELSENFRSRESLLEFINSIFAPLMRPEVGGVEYDSRARLNFAHLPNRQPLAGSAPAVEFHLDLKEKNGDEPGGDEQPMVELTETQREAQIVARRLLELHDSKFQAWDKEQGQFADVGWKDMVILLRAPTQKAEIYAQVFHQAGIPFQAQATGFYEATEIVDLISLLQVLHNPFEDVPTIAVLRSPFVGLSLDELAEIRLANKKEPFWFALNRWHEIADPAHTAFPKVAHFLTRFIAWRQMARETTISERLERIIDETHYLEWLLTQSRAAQRRANIERFLALAQQFDPLQRLGLQRFLRFIKTQQEAEHERHPQPVENPNVVRLMSIHHSKGLEFPVVVVPDLGKPFNFRDVQGHILIDDELGLSPQVRPPGVSGKYPSLPYWMAAQRQKPEMLGEELRLLYVAFTRAQDRLILVGSATSNRAFKIWPDTAPRLSDEYTLSSAGNYLDWLGPLLSAQAGVEQWANASEGETKVFRWRIHRGRISALHRPEQIELNPIPELAASALPELIKKLEWEYPHQAATTISAKQSATLLATAASSKATDEAQQLFSFAPPLPLRPRRRSYKTGGALTSAEIGVAHHTFLHLMDFNAAKSQQTLVEEADRLAAGNYLTVDEREALDVGAIMAFWQSAIGQNVLKHSRHVNREIPFTARLSPAELKELAVPLPAELGDDEFFIVRGAVDLAVILEKEIWIVDFKTDAIKAADLAVATQTYAPQLRLYALALGRIYCRPTSKRYLHFLSLQNTVEI